MSLPTLSPVDFPTLGWQIHDWWETFLRHGPGDILGDRWVPSEQPGTELDAEEILQSVRGQLRQFVLSSQKLSLELFFAGVLEGIGEHQYLSTGCLHSHHDYCCNKHGQAGEKKPAECKWCEAGCLCPCHRKEQAS